MFRKRVKTKLMYKFFVTNEQTGSGYWVVCDWKRKDIYMLYVEDPTKAEDELEDWLKSLRMTKIK